MRKRFLCILLALIFCMPSSTALSAANVSSINTLLIDTYNIAGKYGDTIYFKKTNHDEKIYSVLTGQNQKKTVFKDTVAGKFVVADGWVYYRNAADDSFYKIKGDGTGKKKLSGQGDVIEAVEGSYIYYRKSAYDAELYRMKTDGTGSKLIINSSRFVVAGNWIYYANEDDSKKLYKIGTDGKNKTKLSDTGVSSVIQVIDGWLYFKSDLSYLMRIKTSGSGEKVLANLSVGQVEFSGDWIYYALYSYNYWTGAETFGGLYRVKKDGTGSKCLADEAIYGINYIGNGWIYYQNVDTQVYHSNGSTEKTLYAYKMKTDGSSKKGINMEAYGEAGGYLYYRDIRDNKLYRQNLKTSKSAVVTENKVDNVVFDGNRVFYHDPMQDNCLYKLTSDGKEKKISDAKVGSAYFTGSYIVFENLSDGSKLYRMKNDGTGLVKISDEKPEILAVAGDWLYYRDSDYNIVRMKTDGKKRETVLAADFNNSIKDMTVYNGYYYIYCLDKSIYRIKEGSTEKEKLVDKAYNITFKYGDYIYYDDYKSYSRLNLKTAEVESNIFNVDDYISLKTVYEGKLFYYTTDYTLNADTIYAFDLSTLEKTKIDAITNNNQLDYYSDGWIYDYDYRSYGDAAIRRINAADGTTEELAQGDIGSPTVIDGWLFYVKSSTSYKSELCRVKLD